MAASETSRLPRAEAGNIRACDVLTWWGLSWHWGPMGVQHRPWAVGHGPSFQNRFLGGRGLRAAHVSLRSLVEWAGGGVSARHLTLPGVGTWRVCCTAGAGLWALVLPTEGSAAAPGLSARTGAVTGFVLARGFSGHGPTSSVGIAFPW